MKGVSGVMRFVAHNSPSLRRERNARLPSMGRGEKMRRPIAERELGKTKVYDARELPSKKTIR